VPSDVRRLAPDQQRHDRHRRGTSPPCVSTSPFASRSGSGTWRGRSRSSG
jgi:hypothetical protein